MDYYSVAGENFSMHIIYHMKTEKKFFLQGLSCTDENTSHSFRPQICTCV